MSKCTIEAHQDIVAHLESDRARAEETRRALYPSNSELRFNLEDYASVVRSRRFMYCQTTVGFTFSQSFDRAILSERKYLDDLTAHNDWLSDMVPKKLGKRVAELLKRKLDRHSLMQLPKDADSIKDSYDQVSPCVKVLNVVQKHYSFYRLLTVPGNYDKCTLYLSNCMDKISVCKFIQSSRRVFEYAADYLSEISWNDGI